MTELERAVDALKAAVKQGGIDKHVSDVVNQFTSYLVLLKSSSPSSQSISKLRSILRRPLVPLYTDFPEPALQLSSAVLRKVIDEKLRNALNAQNSQLSASWNEVAVALLSGVLDFLEKNCDDLSKETTASAFYPTICTLFFYQDTALILLPRTQTTAYSLLHDTLVKHPGNQRRLRDHAVLGGSLIGSAISQSRDYLVIEALLNMVGWLIPATHKTEQGKLKRTEFIQELFGSDSQFSCSQELVDILQYISSSRWEDTAMKIIDALARSDITLPQPFALDEVDVCGKTYAQPTAFDRLYLDRDCFLVNVIEKDDVCESLKIPYGHIRSVTIDTTNALPPQNATVHASLAASPIMGEVSLDVMAGQSLYVKFEVQREDLSRLMEALRRRGIVKLSFLGENLSKQISKRKSVGLAHSFRLPGDSSPPPQELQYEDKVKHVENGDVLSAKMPMSLLTLQPTVYETNSLDDARAIIAHTEPEPQPVQQAPARTQAGNKPEVQQAGEHTSAECAPKTVPRPRPISKPANNVAPLPVTSPRKNLAEDILPPAVHASVFGENDEELSELSDEPASKPINKGRLRIRSAKNADVKLSPDLSLSDSIPPLPVTRRTAKRKLVIDSDEEMQAKPKVVQRAAAVSSPNQDTKAEIMTTEPVKTPRMHTRRSSTMQSSSTIEDADNPGMTLLQTPSLPSSKKIHPELVVNATEPCLNEDILLVETQVSLGMPTAKLLPEATTKPTSPAKQNSVASKRAARQVSPSRLAGSSNVPASLAGTRRKREDASSPTEVPLALDDDHPSRKKARNTTGGIETKRDNDAGMLTDPFEPSTSSTTFAKKKYGKKGKVSSPTLPDNIDFDEVPGANPKGKMDRKTNTRAKAGGRASKPVLKKLPARQTRASAMRRRNEKPVESDSPEGIGSKTESSELEIEMVAGSVDRNIEVVYSNDEVTNDLYASLKPESTSSKQVDRDMGQASVSTIAPKDLIKIGNTDAVIIENKLSTSERSIFSTPKLKRAPWEDPVFIAQHVPSDEVKVKPLEVSPQEVPFEPIQDGAPEVICEALFDDYIEYGSISSKGSEDPILPASSNSPPLPLTPRKTPVCIDLTQDLTPAKNCRGLAKDGQVTKDIRMLANKAIHLTESSKKSVTVSDASCRTRPQDEHSACIRVLEPLANDAMEAFVSKDPAPLPEISSRSGEERQEPLAVSKHILAAVRANDAEDSMAEPRDTRLSPPAVPARRRRPVVSFASPLVTGTSYKDTFHMSGMERLTPDVRPNNHGRVGVSIHEIHEVDMHLPKEAILDRGISLTSDDEIESPRPMRKPSSDRVRFDDICLQSSPSPSSLKTNSRLVRSSVPSPLEKRARNSPRDNSYHVKSVESDGIQDIVNVLADIQNVIVKGITNKFKSVNKDVRASRDELLYGAAEDLQALADSYARQFNSFIVLEEDYSKYRATMTRHWEDMIKSSEHLQDDLKKTLQEHDRNVSSKTFPKSLFPPNSIFLKH